MALVDALGRPLRTLRVSLTDRCSLRCAYCMPEEDYAWLPRADLLRFEELAAVVDAFVDLGVDEIHLTGGEPLLRRDVARAVALLAPRVRDLGLTTNGVALGEHAAALKAAGLRRVTVSLDTLRRERFLALTRRDRLADVLAGIAAARAAGLAPLKLNAVVIRGQNDDEVGELLDYAASIGAELRLIEYMDVGGATGWSPARVVPRAEILAAIARHRGEQPAEVARGSDPAARFTLSDGTTFGVIPSVTAPFCGSCDRSRLTADGTFFTCLYAEAGLDLRGPLRAGASRRELRDLVAARWSARVDRGAEERLVAPRRGPSVSQERLKRDPHLEMHTRGG
jgi:cyclic pyranopterin phosphate synthase